MINIDRTAVSTLQFGLELYEKFLNSYNEIEDYDEYNLNNIRFATIAIHNSIELLSKKLLSNIDDFLILDLNLEDDKDLAQSILRCYLNHKNKKINLINSLIHEKFKTIEYSKCIKIIYNMFYFNGFDNRYKDRLDKLGEYRNELIHIGINKNIEIYKLMIVINDSLDIIKNFYRSNIEQGEELINEHLIKFIDVLVSVSKEKITKLWIDSEYGFVEMIVCDIVENLMMLDRVINIDEKCSNKNKLLDGFDIYYINGDSKEKLKSIRIIYNEERRNILLVDENNYILMAICTSYKIYKFWSHGNLVEYIFVAKKDIKLGTCNQYNFNNKGLFDKKEFYDGLKEFIKKALI